MRYLCAILLCGLLWAGTALADTVTIAVPWTQVRRAPSMDGRAIDIVYGNDTFDVIETKDGWAKVRTARKVTGWVLLNDAETKPGEHAAQASRGEKGVTPAAAPQGEVPKNLQATTLSNAAALAKLGFRDQAREKYADLILRNPDSTEAYESARQMLAFYPVGYLPPLKSGAVTDEGKAAIATVLPDVLLQEAIMLQSGQHWARSARIYGYLIDKDAGNGRAFLGLRDTLQHEMTDALAAGHEDDLGAAVSAYRKHFPDSPLPESVQKHLDAAKKG